jgi:hypothetical protein
MEATALGLAYRRRVLNVALIMFIAAGKQQGKTGFPLVNLEH